MSLGLVAGKLSFSYYNTIWPWLFCAVWWKLPLLSHLKLQIPFSFRQGFVCFDFSSSTGLVIRSLPLSSRRWHYSSSFLFPLQWCLCLCVYLCVCIYVYVHIYVKLAGGNKKKAAALGEVLNTWDFGCAHAWRPAQ